MDHAISTKTAGTNLYREIFERSGDAVFIVDPARERFVDVNERACDLLGYTRSTLMKIGPLGVHSHEVALWRKYIAAALRDRSIRIAELSFRMASGDLLPAEVTAAAIEIDDKQSVIITARDLTSRRLIQQALQESEERYRNLVDMSPDAILVNQDGTIAFVNPAGANLLGAENPSEIVGGTLLDIVAPEYRNLVQERMRRVLEFGETAPPAEVELLRIDGSRLHFEGIGIPINFHGARALQVVLRDISERKRMEHERSVLAEIGALVGSTLAIEEVYEQFADQVQKLIPSDRIVISDVDIDAWTITPVYIAGLQIDGWPPNIPHSLALTPLENVVRNQTPLVMNIGESERLAQSHSGLVDGLEAGLKSGLGVPLIARNSTVGILSLKRIDSRDYTSQELELAQRVANQIAPAVENARLYKQAGEIAMLEERNRLARELHDSVAQTLFSLTLYSEASVRYAQAGDMERVRAILGQLGESSLQALREMRLLVHQLRPRELEERGLISALQNRLDAVEGRSGIQARLILDREYSLPAKIENALFPVALEALNNTIKHSNASAVEIGVQTVDGGIELTVEDNGRGFEFTEQSAQAGVGLSSMNERLRGIDGSLSVTSIVGKGTTVRAFVEIDSPDPEPSDAGQKKGRKE